MDLVVALYLMLSVTLSATHDGGPWITRADYDSLSIVVAESASPSEHYGAEQFKEYWSKCTGYDVPLGSVPRNRLTVWVGRDSLPPELRDSVNPEGLEPDGLHIKTVGNNLIIVGGRQRGTMYGVFEFFERWMGVRWLAPDCTHIPEPPESLPTIDFRHVPPFEWRDINYRAFQDPHFAVVHHLNGQFPDIPPAMGGHIAFANGFGHTFYSFISPDDYGKEHPEYFSEVDGERRTERNSTQLCLTNPDVLRIVIAKTRDILRKRSSEHPIVSITQMDTGFWCECAQCAAIDKREGSQSGSVLWFVNQVADAIAEEFSHAYIDTFAYTYTRKPPKHIRPRDNVIVRLCSIECNFSRPHGDRHSPQNRAFHADIDRWSKITKNLYVWDYTQNWYCHQQPHPNFHVLQPNIRFFAEHRVRGLFEQASPTSPHSDFEYLKGYILARAMWYPEADGQESFNEFIDLYYRDAGPYIREYIDLITRKVLDDNYYLSFNSKLEWMDAKTVLAAEAIFSRAFASTQDPAVLDRLKSIYLSVQYAALVCRPEVTMERDAIILNRPPSLTFDEYWTLLQKMGVTMLEDVPIGNLQERLKGQTPPRYQRLSIEKLGNPFYEVWVVPDLQGSVVRFVDKESGIDLFRGPESIINGRWLWQDWDVMDPEHPKIEEGVSTPYKVVERQNDRIAVETELPNGLSVRRTMILGPDARALEVELTVTNRGNTPIVPRVKQHPEFWLGGAYAPQIWLQRKGVWQKEPLKYVASGQGGADYLDPKGIERWAYHVPQTHRTLVVTVPPKNVQKLFYFFDVQNGQANLEFIPDLSPLAPGASRSLAAHYAVAQKKPSKL